jgi:hypothetical protein
MTKKRDRITKTEEGANAMVDWMDSVNRILLNLEERIKKLENPSSNSKEISWTIDTQTKELIIWNSAGSRANPDIIMNDELQRKLLHLLKDIFE